MSSLSEQGKNLIEEWARWSRGGKINLEPSNTALGKVVKEGGFLPPTEGKSAGIFMPEDVEATEKAICALSQTMPKTFEAIVRLHVKRESRARTTKRLHINKKTYDELIEQGYRYVARTQENPLW